MLKIAITGGIGSGKSTACKYIESKGYTVIDADAMARAVTASGGKAIPYIRAHFGDEYILEDGSMDRAKIRNLVFDDPSAMAILEEGTTKVVIEDIGRIIEESKSKDVRALFFEIPLLFETGSREDYDQVWVITANLETRIERVKQRDKLERAQIEKIINSQISEQKRLDLADEIIYNNEVADEMKYHIDELLQKNNLL